MTRQAVLLVNLGSPASTSPDDVRRYLDEFLMDPFVLDMPGWARALLVRGVILRTRPEHSAEAYARIWTAEGSPLVAISQRTRAALEARMQLPVGLAMRYGEPSIPGATAELLARAGSLDELIVVPLYPHYAMATTKTVEVAVGAALAGAGVPYRFVPPFYDDPAYLDALAARVRTDLPGDVDRLLFSYHGIPRRHVRKTDPTGAHCLRSADCCEQSSAAWGTCYRYQVLTTMHAVAQRLGLPTDGYEIAFQSRLGGGWLEPFTDRVLVELPRRGVTRLAVVCPAFVADCLETLEEIAIRGRETFLEAGGTAYTYIPCLNDDPGWIDALATLCRKPSEVPV